MKLKYLTEDRAKLACRVLNSYEPNCNVYALGPMLKDVMGFDRAEAKEAFLYWISYNRDFDTLVNKEKV